MLRAAGLTRRFGEVVALDGLDLVVEGGEIVCLLGANGAGKTTTINLFLGFLSPTAGEVTVDGLSPTTAPREVRSRLAYIPEQVNLYPLLTGAENLAYFTTLARGEPPSHTRALELFRAAGLQEADVDRPVATYSKGMRQKVGIAIALAKDAKALLLDEPLSGLDPKAASDFCGLLLQLKDRGVAVLMATHDLLRARAVGTRVGIMRRGRLVDTRATDALDYGELERVYLELMST